MSAEIFSLLLYFFHFSLSQISNLVPTPIIITSFVISAYSLNVLTNKSLMVSKDGILYSLDKESLVKYTGKIDEEVLKETALKQKQDISKKRLLKRKNKKMKK